VDKFAFNGHDDMPQHANWHVNLSGKWNYVVLSHISMQCHFVLRYELWYKMNSFKSLEKKYFLETNQDFLKCLTIFAIGNVNAFIHQNILRRWNIAS